MLQIAEKFFSVQGEGATVGTPAYFIRLQGCNLMCGGQNASLVKEGKATWWCDTEMVWRNGIPTSNEDLNQAIDKACGIQNILDGRVHLVWTGGEPALPRSRKSITEFMDYFTDKHGSIDMYNEIETNGTVYVDDDRFYGQGSVPSLTIEELLAKWSDVIGPMSVTSSSLSCDLRIPKVLQSHVRKDFPVITESYAWTRTRIIDQINCSPKLVNSGMSKRIRIIPKAIEQICKHENYWFKFVISSEEDMKEIENDFVKPFSINPARVILMPACDNSKDLPEATRFMFEMAKKYKYRAVTRQHILAWGKTIGV